MRPGPLDVARKSIAHMPIGIHLGRLEDRRPVEEQARLVREIVASAQFCLAFTKLLAEDSGT